MNGIGTSGNGPLRAGVAAGDITTSAEGAVINDPLYARALALDDGRTKAVIISMDVVAIGGINDIRDDFLSRLRGRIEKELGIPGGNVLVHATHTHPPGRLLCDDDEQVERTFDAVSRALEDMTPAKVGAGVGYEDRIMINRTLRMKDGRHWTVRHANPCPPEDEVERLGPVDPEIGILRIDRADGGPLAVVYNFACHPLIGIAGGHITANYPGFASKVIESNFGGTALFLQGAGGDVTELLYKDVSRPRDAEPIGTMLGLSALEAVREIPTGEADLNIISETVELPRRTDIPERIDSLRREQAELLESLRLTSLNFKMFLPLYIKYALNPDFPGDYSYRYMHAEMTGSDRLAAMDSENRANIGRYLANISAMEKLARIQDTIDTLKWHQSENDKSGKATVSAEVQGIRIGNCVLISCPAEALVEIGLNIKRSSPYRHTFMAACSNGYLHYGAPAEYYGKGGYEVTECLLGSGWQDVYEQKALDIIGRL